MNNGAFKKSNTEAETNTEWYENFAGVNFSVQIGDFLFFAETNIAIRADCFFLLELIFAIFRKYPAALIIFSFFVKYDPPYYPQSF